jgi:hypothetical protein
MNCSYSSSIVQPWERRLQSNQIEQIHALNLEQKDALGIHSCIREQAMQENVLLH